MATKNITREYIIDNLDGITVSPNEAYLIPSEAGKHYRVVTDKNGIISEQVDNTVSNHVRNISEEQVLSWEESLDKITILQNKIAEIEEWKTSMTVEDVDNIINTLHDIVQTFNTITEDKNIQLLFDSKINILDIVDNLTSNSTNVPLSAKQGNILRGLYLQVQEQINNGNIPNKLDKPSETITELDSETRYVYMLDEEDKGKAILIDDLLKTETNDLSIELKYENNILTLNNKISKFQDEITNSDTIELSFIPYSVDGVFFNGLLLPKEEYNIILPNSIQVLNQDINSSSRIIVIYNHIIENA